MPSDGRYATLKGAAGKSTHSMRMNTLNEQLLEAGANVQPEGEWTPLRYALYNEDEELERLLRNYGATH